MSLRLDLSAPAPLQLQEHSATSGFFIPEKSDSHGVCERRTKSVSFSLFARTERMNFMSALIRVDSHAQLIC